MKRLFLVQGLPGAGKTYLASKLFEQSKLPMLSVDQAYVEFVRKKWSKLYFPALEDLIMDHYNLMLELNRRNYCNQGFVKDWQSHLLQEIKSRLASEADGLVIDGYLLYDCKDDIEASLSTDAHIFSIHVEDKKYFWVNNVMSIDEVAALGAPE